MPPSKDIEPLRTEIQQLGSRITRISIILISVLALVVLTLTNALQKVDLRELQQELDTAQRATRIYWEIYYERAYGSGQSAAGTENHKDQEKDKLRGLWMEASNHEKQIKQKYDAAMKESFSISPAILGSSLNIDLRWWIYSVPFIILTVVIYILLLRKKQKVLLWIAASLLSECKENTPFDRLTFSESPGRETPYSRTPSELERAIYLLVIIFLLSLIIVVLSAADVVFLGLSPIETVQYTLMLLIMGFYGSSYYFFVSTSLNQDVQALTGYRVKSPFCVTALKQLQTSISWVANRLPPKISLTTASLLILSSLFLATSASCETPLPGYKMLRENGEGSWISSTGFPSAGAFGRYWQDSINTFGRYSYILALLVAVLTLFLVLSSITRLRLFRRPKIHSVLFGLSSTVALFTIVDFSCNMFWLKDEVFILSNFFWMVPAVLLWKASFANDDTWPQWRVIKPFLVLFILPLFIIASVFVIYAAMKAFHGVIVYFLGINLLSFTYMSIVRLSRK